MFIVGLLVGRGTAPVRFDIEKLQNELAELRKDASEREKKKDLKTVKKVKDKTELDFYEALKEKPPAEPVKKIEPIKPPGGQKVKPSEKKAVPPKKTGKKAVKAAGKKAPSKKDPKAFTTKKNSEGNFTIQVAALKDTKVAEQLVDRLKKKGYSAYRTIVKIPGKGVWYRIRIGSYHTRADAARTLKRLKQDGLEGFLVNK